MKNCGGDLTKSPTLAGSFEHGLHVLDGNVLLDIVNLREDKSASTSGENFNVAAYMLPDFFGGAKRQHFLRVASSAPEDDLSPIVLHQSFWLHVAGGDLYRMQDVDSGLNPFRDVVVN